MKLAQLDRHKAAPWNASLATTPLGVATFIVKPVTFYKKPCKGDTIIVRKVPPLQGLYQNKTRHAIKVTTPNGVE